MSPRPAVGDTVSWKVHVCPGLGPGVGPPDQHLRVFEHRRYGRVLEVWEGGVLAWPLGLEYYADRDHMAREGYVRLLPDSMKHAALCDGSYTHHPHGVPMCPGRPST